MKTPKPYHLLVYVDNSNMRMKKFSTTKKMGQFIDRFLKKYPDYASGDSGYWIDFTIENVSGPVRFFTDGIKLS